jgi:hypothetical protein
MRYSGQLWVSVANSSCAGLADAVEGISHDTLNCLLKLLAILQRRETAAIWLDWPTLRRLYKIRSTIEESFKVLKQECA